MPYTTVSLGDLKVGMRERWDDVPFWTNEEARRAINEALRLWNLMVGRWHRRLTVVLAANQVTVPLGATLIYGARVTVTSQPLTVASLIELDLARPRWRDERTTDGGDVPARPIIWVPRSLQTIEIWPAIVAPGSALIVDGVAATPVLRGDDDRVDLGEELHDPLLDFALHVAAFKEGGPRWRATIPQFTQFLQAAAEQNALLKASRAFRRFAGLDRRRDLQPTHAKGTQLDGLPTPGAGQP